MQEFCVCISSPWPVLERFFGGFYGGVEKPSFGFIVLNEIVKMEAITKVEDSIKQFFKIRIETKLVEKRNGIDPQSISNYNEYKYFENSDTWYVYTR